MNTFSRITLYHNWVYLSTPKHNILSHINRKVPHLVVIVYGQPRPDKRHDAI